MHIFLSHHIPPSESTTTTTLYNHMLPTGEKKIHSCRSYFKYEEPKLNAIKESKRKILSIYRKFTQAKLFYIELPKTQKKIVNTLRSFCVCVLSNASLLHFANPYLTLCICVCSCVCTNSITQITMCSRTTNLSFKNICVSHNAQYEIQIKLMLVYRFYGCNLISTTNKSNWSRVNHEIQVNVIWMGGKTAWKCDTRCAQHEFNRIKTLRMR